MTRGRLCARSSWKGPNSCFPVSLCKSSIGSRGGRCESIGCGKTPRSKTIQLFSGGAAQTAKDYLDRVARYVPAEILAAYLTLLPLVIGTTKDNPPSALLSWR
jgi:hypothetical protein